MKNSFQIKITSTKNVLKSDNNLTLIIFLSQRSLQIWRFLGSVAKNPF
jgi:hypothetical protein